MWKYIIGKYSIVHPPSFSSSFSLLFSSSSLPILSWSCLYPSHSLPPPSPHTPYSFYHSLLALPLLPRKNFLFPIQNMHVHDLSLSKCWLRVFPTPYSFQQVSERWQGSFCPWRKIINNSWDRIFSWCFWGEWQTSPR